MSSSTRKYMSKRQRACDFCRLRKTACRIEGHLPCRLCALHGKQCTFIEAAQPRKRPATSNEDGTSGPTVHNTASIMDTTVVPPVYDFTPTLTASTSPQNPGLSDSASYQITQQEHITSGSPSQTLLFGSVADHFFDGFGEGNHDAQHGHTFPTFEVGMSPEGFLATMYHERSPDWFNASATEIQLDSNTGLHPQILGHSGDMDPYLLQHYRYGPGDAFKFKQLTIRSVCQGKAPAQFLLSQPELFAPSREELGVRQIPIEITKEELETLVSADTGIRLIALFRKFILPQYPIFAETQFPDPQSSPPHLLASIYMVAQPFARFDDVLSVELAYDTLNNSALLQLINRALQYEAHDPSLSLVQTILLLLLRPSTNLLILESSYKWSLHGQLITTAQTLGLHHDPGSWTIAPWQIALRRRISSTIYALDKWLATSLGRPPLVTYDTWIVTTVAIEDGFSSALSPEAWSQHMCYAKLGSLLGDVLKQLYSIRAIQGAKSNIQSTLRISKVLLAELSEWYEDCQSSAPEESEETAALCTINILGFHFVQMTIFRAIIRAFVVNTSSGDEALEDAADIPLNQEEITGFARTGVRSSTASATKFVKSLKEGHFHMYWPYWSQVAFSCVPFLNLLMAVTSPDMDEAISWFRDLHTARREMRLKSNMLPVLRLGLLRIDALFWKGIDKVLHLQPHVKDALDASLNLNTG